MDSDYDEEEEEEQEEQQEHDDIDFNDRCKIIEVKSAALVALVAAHPLKIKGKKELNASIDACVADIGEHLELLQPPRAVAAPAAATPPRKRERSEGDDEPYYAVSDRATMLGIVLTTEQKKEAGLLVFRAYEKRYGKIPTKKAIKGKDFEINEYTEQECIKVVDPILKKYGR